MKPSDHIFFLVKSLTKTERAYFTKFAQRHGLNNNSNYLKLFRGIEAQDIYDEKALVKKLGDAQLAKQIHVYKNYLYKLILRALHNYYSGNTSTAKISELIHYSEILKERGLFNQAKKVLEQANEIAAEYEHKELLLDILRRKADMLISTQEFDEESEATIRKAHAETIELLRKIEWVSEKNMQASLIRMGMRTKGLYIIADEQGGVMPFKDDSEYSSFDSKKLNYWTLGILHKMKGEFKESLSYFNILLNLFDKNKQQVDENLQFYISCLYHVITTAENIDDDKTYQLTVKKLKQLDDRLANEPRFYSSSLRIKMMYYETVMFNLFKNGQIDKVKELAQQVEKEKLVEKVEQYTFTHGQEYLEGRKEAMIFYCGVFLLESGYSKDSIRWLNRLAAAKGDAAKSGQRMLAKLIIIVAYYEAQEYELLKSAARHYLRLIDRHEAKYKFEKILVNTLLKLSVTDTRKAKAVLYNDLKDNILSYSEQYDHLFHYFDFKEWIESKVTGKTMPEILSVKS